MSSLSGVNFIYDAVGSLDSTLSASYEQVLMDDELCGIAARAAKGVEVSSESLALEVIEDMGPGGLY